MEQASREQEKLPEHGGKFLPLGRNAGQKITLKNVPVLEL